MSAPLTDRINSLISQANEATGASNTTLSDAVETLIAGYGGVGYNITKINDGNAHLYLDVIDKYLTISIYVGATSGYAGVFTVDWGDGTIITCDTTSTTFSKVEHTYVIPGFYHAVFAEVEPPTSPNKRYFGGAGNVFVLGGGNVPERFQQSCLVGFEAGNWYIGGGQTFMYSRSEKIYLGSSNVIAYNNFCRSCQSLKEIELPATLTSIGSYGFSECYMLNDIAIPSSVTSIGSYAFNSTGYINIHMKSATPPMLDGNAFKNQCIPTIYVPEGSLATYQTANNWAAYASSMQEEN